MSVKGERNKKKQFVALLSNDCLKNHTGPGPDIIEPNELSSYK